MTIGDGYGQQSNGILVTHEDVEKRRLDRERAKKLSQETNRRRKALEDRKKLAVEREKRKISLELNKRRQKQSEATEKYQRSTFSARTSAGVDRRSKSSYGRGIPSLDNILQQLRSGSTEISYASPNHHHHHNGDSHYGHNSSNQHNRKQQEYYQHHNSLMESKNNNNSNKIQHHNGSISINETSASKPSSSSAAAPVPAKHPYQQRQHQISEMVATGNRTSLLSNGGGVNSSHVNLDDSLEASKSDKLNLTCPPMPAVGYTNADLMSGRSHQQHHEHLSDNLSRLFIQNQHCSTRSTYEMPQAYSKQTFSNDECTEGKSSNYQQHSIKIEEADNADAEKQNVHSSKLDEMKGNGLGKSGENDDSCLADSLDVSNNTNDSNFDEDSLHGSSSGSGAAETTATNLSAFPPPSSPATTTTTARNSSVVTKTSSRGVTWKTEAKKEEKGGKTMTMVTNGGDGHRGTKWGRTVPATEYHVIEEPWSAAQRPSSSASAVPKVSRGRVSFSGEHDEPSPQEEEEREKGDPPPPGEMGESSKDKEDAGKPRGILKKFSKYGQHHRNPQPHTYHAQALVREQWVNDVGAVRRHHPDTNTDPAPELSKLRKRMSVRWNEIQYDDGTSASIVGGGATRTNTAPLTAQTAADAPAGKKASGKGGKTSGRASGKASGKGRGSRASKKGKGSRKGGEGAGSEKSEGSDGGKRKVELSSTNALHYSIDDDSTTVVTSTQQSQQLPKTSKIAWKAADASSDVIGMSNLKSRGNDSSSTSSDHVASVERTGNHVTIRVIAHDDDEADGMIEDMDEGGATSSGGNVDNFNLSKTPTDLEINQLWENVRSVIAKRAKDNSNNASSSMATSTNNNKTIINRTTFEPQRYNGINPSARTPGASNHHLYNQQHQQRRTAWSTHHHQYQQQQQQPSIVSIDGGLLMHDGGTRGGGFNPTYRTMITNHQYKQQQQRRGHRRFVRPNYHNAVSSTPSRSTGNAANGADGYSNFYMRHQALLQQRRHKQYMSTNDMMSPNFKTYPGVKTSYQLPYTTAHGASTGKHQGGSSNGDQQSSSTAAFLLAEALAEQNVSEEQMMIALDSIQRKSIEAQKLGKNLNPSALSMEEQRVLASLDRLNTRLHEIDATVSNNPNIQQHFANKTVPLPQTEPTSNNVLMSKRLRRNNNTVGGNHSNMLQRPRY